MFPTESCPSCLLVQCHSQVQPTVAWVLQQAIANSDVQTPVGAYLEMWSAVSSHCLRVTVPDAWFSDWEMTNIQMHPD
jgi:hypothetical protein